MSMVAMGALAESRDPETGNHIRRTQYYVKVLANELKDYTKFGELFTPEKIELMYKSAPLHDIGKVGVPDHILLKPGRLTDEEFVEMKKHVSYGNRAIETAQNLLDEPDNFLVIAREIAYYHHEKWDGSGYMEGLSGDDIPVSARLMAVADVYDALISKRIYKPPFPHEKAAAIIEEGAGSHFDPTVVEAFIKVANEFNEIAKKYIDVD